MPEINNVATTYPQCPQCGTIVKDKGNIITCEKCGTLLTMNTREQAVCSKCDNLFWRFIGNQVSVCPSCLAIATTSDLGSHERGAENLVTYDDHLRNGFKLLRDEGGNVEVEHD